MEIYLTKDGKSVGPFTAEELRARIASGDADPDESAWSAETGDWKRLVTVLAKADELTAASERPKSSKLRPQGAASVPAATGEGPPEREKSSKLHRVGDSPDAGGKSKSKWKWKKDKGDGAEPIRALPSRTEQNRQAKKHGVGERANPFRALRWLGLIGFVTFVFSIYMPWVSVVSSGGHNEFSAVRVVKATSNEISLPGTTAMPKYFNTSKMAVLGVALGALLIALLTFANAANAEADSSALGIFLAVLTIAGAISFAVMHRGTIESQVNAALAAMPGDQRVDFVMDAGFYIALASVVLMAAFLAVPQQLFGTMGAAFTPFVVLFLIGGGLAAVGFKKLGSRSAAVIEEVLTEIKTDTGEVTKVVKEKIDAVSPELIPDPPPAGSGEGGAKEKVEDKDKDDAPADPFAPE